MDVAANFANGRGARQFGAGTKFLLSELSEAPVYLRERRIGKLRDFVTQEISPLPHVTHIVVKRRFGAEDLVIPSERVARLGHDRIVVDGGSLADYAGPSPKGALFLRDYVLDKKVIDLEGREVSVVFDVRLLWVQATRKIWVSDVEFGRRAALRRLGLEWIANLFNMEDDSVSWSYIQPLPETIGSFKGDIRLKALKEQINDIPAVDLADILEELDESQRTALFSQLGTEEASDTLEEIDPSVQRQLISTLDDATVVRLLDLMTPAQAADVLAILPFDDKRDIMARFAAQRREQVQAILDKQEESILHYATGRYIALPPQTSAGEVVARYAEIAKGKDVAMYIYVTDPSGHLSGVVDIKEILMSDASVPLSEIMTESVVSLEPESTLRDAYDLFTRYDFRALPVLDEERKVLGVIVYKDVMGLKHRFVA